jgi:hypothetical protein
LFLFTSLYQFATLFISAVTLLFLIREVPPHTVATAGLETLTFKGTAKNALIIFQAVVVNTVSL